MDYMGCAARPPIASEAALLRIEAVARGPWQIRISWDGELWITQGEHYSRDHLKKEKSGPCAKFKAQSREGHVLAQGQLKGNRQLTLTAPGPGALRATPSSIVLTLPRAAPTRVALRALACE